MQILIYGKGLATSGPMFASGSGGGGDGPPKKAKVRGPLGKLWDWIKGKLGL